MCSLSLAIPVLFNLMFLVLSLEKPYEIDWKIASCMQFWHLNIIYEWRYLNIFRIKLKLEVGIKQVK